MNIGWIANKYLLTALVVVVVSEIARRSDKLGALIAALPLVTILALIWLHVEGGSAEKVSNHAWYTLWYVIPTLPMFIVFPMLMQRVGFWAALGMSAAVTVASFLVFVHVLKKFGIDIAI